MGPYRYVCELQLDGIKYVMFMDKHNKRLFLKHTENGLDYPTESELFSLVENLYHSEDVYDFADDKYSSNKIIPKIIIGGTAVTLTPAILLTSLVMYNRYKCDTAKREYINNVAINPDDKKFSTNSMSFERLDDEYINNYLSTAESYVNDGNIIDTYLYSDICNYVYIYDMDYIDLVYEKKNITIDDLKSVITNNNNIPDDFKALLFEYCDQLFKTYDNIELRPFYENLKDLKIVECSKYELLLHTLNADSYGCYVRSENTIYVPENYEYKKGTWEYQVIFHEISHCLRTRMATENGVKVKIQCEGLNFSNLTTAEALNSLFTVSLLGYEENDIAYQLQSNYHRVMIECMDNYDLSDYANHSVSYYVSKLDEYTGMDGYAPVIVELIQLQYDDFHNQDLTISQDQYYPIYDYISRMYFDKYISQDMTYDEMKAVVDELVSKITFDVPSEYNIDVNHFYKFFEYYLSEKGYCKTR